MKDKRNILVTGGMGFIGLNTVLRFSMEGYKVYVLDSLNKIGLLHHLQTLNYNNAVLLKGDIRDEKDVVDAFYKNSYDAVIHLAAQTAVTKSVENPRNDFMHNALGTFNVLEAARIFCPDAKFIFASTNKVYGNLNQYTVIKHKKRYTLPVNIDEQEPLDFHSPYGCSKGVADQYVRDYHRIYGMDTNVVRQSCIYGPYQDGTEDQGWVAWFVKAFLTKQPITIYGNGKQARDILHVNDLVSFYKLLIEEGPPGEIYNIGGGHNNVVSLLELISILEKRIGLAVNISYADERPGDQKVFVSDNSKALELGWKIDIPKDDGIGLLINSLRLELK